jgi:hypothetical protein
MVGGGFPYAVLHDEMRAAGVLPATAPSIDASRIEVMRQLWTDAGLNAVETREIVVQRTFTDFEEYWTTIRGGPSVGGKLAAMMPDALAALKARMQTCLSADSLGRITYSARANAIRGRVRQ